VPAGEGERVVVRYGAFEAVRDVSLSVAEGEVFGLLGPNGAGKTSLLRVLVTLLRPHAGEARILGHDVVARPTVVRRLIGYVPQALSADGSLSGMENAMLFARLYDVPWRRRRATVHDALDLMGLSAAAGKLVRAYSGGMIRRLEIACALLSRPRVLFLDEPTIGLDPIARRTVWDHLGRLRRDQGTTLFVTTHDMEEANQRCERIGIMGAGRVLAVGTTAELCAAAGVPEERLEDAFVALAGPTLAEGTGGLVATRRSRRTARRLG
jgi:ABC-2 type transport system ATP-binding protein